MKHFFRAASFGKKYDEKNEFDHHQYLNCRRHMSVITRLHRSDTCDRQITYKQFESCSKDSLLKCLFKFKGYKEAENIVETLNLYKYLSLVYEDWIITMLKLSKLPNFTLRERIKGRIDSLRT